MEKHAFSSLHQGIKVVVCLLALSTVSACRTVQQQRVEVLYEFSKENSYVYHPVVMPIAACRDGFIIVSRDQIYKITDYDFNNPKLICDARRPGWEVAARHGDGANEVMKVSDVICTPKDRIFFCGDGYVKEVLRSGQMRVVAGTMEDDYVDSKDGRKARFGNRMGLSYWKGNLLLADCLNNALRLVNLETGAVTTFWGRQEESWLYKILHEKRNKINPTSTDGDFKQATLRGPSYIFGQAEKDLIIVICSSQNGDSSEFTVRCVDMKKRRVETLAGKTYSVPEIKDGPREISRLDWATSSTIDDKGNVYIVNGSFIRRITPNGLTSTIYQNILKSGDQGSILAVVFDCKTSSLILFDDECVKRVKLLQ
jgi:hypothetical protein